MQTTYLEFVRSAPPGLFRLQAESNLDQQLRMVEITQTLAYREGGYNVACFVHNPTHLRDRAISHHLGVNLNDLAYARIWVTEEPWKSRYDAYLRWVERAEKTTGNIYYIPPTRTPDDLVDILMEQKAKAAQMARRLVAVAYEYNLCGWNIRRSHDLDADEITRNLAQQIAEQEGIHFIVISP